MRRFAILLVPFFVAGCALPPALTLASFAADGVSYVATGKSTTDHALSALAQEDCALVRAVKEEPICVPNSKAPVVVAATEPPAKRHSAPDGKDALYQSSPISALAFMQAHRNSGVGPSPAAPLQLAEKTLPTKPAAGDAFHLATKDRPIAPYWPGIPRKISQIVLSDCPSGGSMQPAAQCALGPDA